MIAIESELGEVTTFIVTFPTQPLISAKKHVEIKRVSREIFCF
jgi:hypothetical protein